MTDQQTSRTNITEALRRLLDSLGRYEAVWMTSRTGYGEVAEAKAEARDALAAEPDAVIAPDEPSTWKELIAAGRASGIEIAPDEPSRQRLNDEYMRGYNAASRFLDGLIAIERKAAREEARAASASVPPFGASKANPFTKKIDVVADTPEQGK